MKLGSLFDGSGGFPLAGVLNGIEPVWASEIEPYPMKVTAARFPRMKQLGDVTQIDGAAVEPVDVITFGSPCQDLSVAGKQAGIHEGERSSLFFEAIRIIKEMRHGTADKYPRFAVWENVPGAFSSNRGQDFRAVLQAFCGICGEQADIVPEPPKGRWLPAGCIVGNGWSVAWRVYDAQYWGVPQRRKRIYLIADFAGERAGEILFEPESLRGDSEESGTEGETTSGDAERSTGRSDQVRCLNPWDCQSKRQYEVGGAYTTLNAGQGGGGQAHGVCYAIDSTGSNAMKSSNPHSGFHEEQVTKTLDTHPDPTCAQGGNVIVSQVAYSIEGHVVDRNTGQNGRGWTEGYAHTLNATDRHAVAFMGGQEVCYIPEGNHCTAYREDDKSATLCTKYHYGNGGDAAMVVHDCRGNGDGEVCPTLTGDHQNRVTDYTTVCVGDVARCLSMSEYTLDGTCSTLKERDYKGGAVDYVVDRKNRKYIVRRLTPLECCRLQGFPDWWTDGVEGSDTAQYKMWGNGVALPCCYDAMRRIAKEFERGNKHGIDDSGTA